MYDSLINVNGNQFPTLEILLLLTIVALLPSFDHHDDFFFSDGHYPVIFAKCAWNPTDSAQYGVGRDFLIFDNCSLWIR